MEALEQAHATIDFQREGSGGGLRTRESSQALIRRKRKEIVIPSGLVISGDDAVRGTLGEALLLCGVAPVFANSLEQAARDIRAGKMSFGICQDELPDGKYKEVLLMKHAFENSFPLIVVSRTGDWPEYFEAIELGASDFLAYPLIPGELQRIVCNLLQELRAGGQENLGLGVDTGSLWAV